MNSPSIQNRYVVQGLEIHVSSHQLAEPLLSNYFFSLYKGEAPLGTRPLHFSVYLTEQTPPVPAGSKRAIKGPSVTSYKNGEEIYFVSGDGSIILFDPPGKRAKCILNKKILQDGFGLAPLMSAAISEALRYNGFHYLHSAGLYGCGKGYLVAGNGGSGKTTAAASMVREGFKYVSDDSLLFRECGAEILLFPFYSNRNFHFDGDLANRFPELSDGKSAEIEAGTKVPVDISRKFPDLFTPRLKPHVIIFPSITSCARSVLLSLHRGEAFIRLLKQTILAVDHAVARDQLRVMRRLVHQVISFELLGGRDVYENPKKLVDIIEAVRV